jgi:hypothetical protein
MEVRSSEVFAVAKRFDHEVAGVNMAGSRQTLIYCLFLLICIGCGKPPMRSVEGTVKLNGMPVANCKVGFFPDTETFNPDRHGFGFGVTDEQGHYIIQHPQGEEGIWAGNYKVTFVAWVDQTGKSLGVEIKPSEVEGGVINRFPEIYEAPSTTPERVTVGSDSRLNVFDFDIQSPK